MATEDEHPPQPDIAAMLTDQTSACSTARDAIAAGGEVIVWDGLVPASQHVGVFRIRLRSIERHGNTALGLDESIQILRQHGDEPVRTGCITSRSVAFTLFLNADATQLLACGGVKREAPKEP
ncbi:hypothetical protein OOK36_55400 [Streptomyces sp. NBC_00365]|uniref:hypothetical protein n=1 Tax=Streptomyces sp. NBC_00365 TaxID=2975726 RepID=UPI002256A0FC|nr:hypothetical protein [Streptomyces sp. NBC_00365]MCX5097642.1 hypothetical protein [Streptomyces sp. NBC_00365]